MKKYIKTILILSLMWTSTMVFAFPADPDLTPDPATPINDYVIGFLIVSSGSDYWKV